MKSFLSITLLAFSLNVFADGFKTSEDTKEFSDTLMTKIKSEKFTEGFDSVKPYWPIPEVEIDSLVNDINKQWPLISKRFGKSIDTEFVRKEKIGNSFIKYYYLHKFDKHAIYWAISYYKPHNEWVVNTITFKDNLDLLYEYE